MSHLLEQKQEPQEQEPSSLPTSPNKRQYNSQLLSCPRMPTHRHRFRLPHPNHLMTLSITKDQAIGCCASPAWAEKLAACPPFRDFYNLVDAARRIWWAEIGPTEWLTAFQAHPKIGDNRAVEQKPAAFAAFSRSEQAAANETANADIAQELLRWNR